jgi:hypothetical protein
MKTVLQKISILKSLFLLALVGVVGFMATQALFIDRETSQDSSFVVGTLDMTVTGPGSQQAESIQVTGLGSQNIVSGGKTWTIHNIGSLPGTFSFALENLQNIENGCNEPEALEDTTCASPGEGQGELGAQIATTIRLQPDGEAARVVFSSDLSTAQVAQYAILWQQNAGEVIIPAGKTIQITMEWSTENNQLSNVVQSDKVLFDILFNLNQVIPGSTN